ncbi:hypothetical protein ACFQLX_16590 [Streptomyces polyrhachis]|uniref:Serine protease n=1 Tax=Streptomyces polyrhachis TaxID=1282885 RepID=A0ABW2GJP0_9ACTN
MSRPEMMRGPTGGQVSDSSRQQAQSDFLNPQRPLSNVIGFGHGVKWTHGRPTGEEAVLVFVTQKVPESMLPERDVVPRQMDDGTPTDVLAVGQVSAQRSTARRQGIPGQRAEEERMPRSDGGMAEFLAPPLPEEPQSRMALEPQLLTRRLRPCPAGYSIGNIRVTAGTLGSVVYDFLPGATTDPPGPGLGVPAKFYVLSNNHVLADSNRAQPGSPILQPGVFDGGMDPQDRIATLERFVSIQFAPQIPLDRHNKALFSRSCREVTSNSACR